MIPSPKTWLKWAALFMPHNRSDWLAAMFAELGEIDEDKERQSFAWGCFTTAIAEWPKSRKGLSQLSRLTGASVLTVVGFLGLYQSYFMQFQTETAGLSKIIAMLCFIYLFSAFLLVSSVKNLKLFSLAGIVFGVMFWIYFQYWFIGTEALPQRFLTAVSFEATGMMGSLFLTATYLRWLYDPEAMDPEAMDKV